MAGALVLFHSGGQTTRIPRHLPLRRPDHLEPAQHRICRGRGPRPWIWPREIIFSIVSVAGSVLGWQGRFLMSSVAGFHHHRRFQLGRDGEGTQLCRDVGFDVCSEATSGWTIRVRINCLVSNI
ncbi:uncharacterized protein [Triticum aestivum]|uniref:uncharacterized protein isoform X1 n=1 Tax=Triticum aestivum TaxID=4565 RepID=UPI001D0272A0|nr:uncharacterized protein LOC123112132 isoform X1 [Triticum aestivum]